MIKPNRRKFLQDLIWYVVKTLTARENYIKQVFIVSSSPEIIGMTKRRKRLAAHLS
jgi:predicted ATPase